jgi:hypothetical protein
MKFCPVVSEICRGQVHGPRKERRKRRRRRRRIKIIIRNGAKTGEGIILTKLIQVATAPFYQFNTHPYHPHTSFTGIFK